MKLFSSSQIATINKVAESSKASKSNPKKVDKNITSELSRISQQVVEYFKDSEAILITTRDELHSYIDKVIEAGIFAYDTETTGLDRFRDHIVGSSLYYPGGVECYIPNKHLVPIFDQPYKNQLDYEDVKAEFDRLVSAKCKLILFNADFDLAVTHIWYKVDFMPIFYFDCYVAWKCLKENELHNGLKELYNKYVLKGKGDPKKFTDFFKVSLFPYCKPQIAKLYAANDAKITFVFYEWLLPYVTKDDPKCKENQLERIADLIWNIEFPMVKICQILFRTGIYLDTDVSNALITRYHKEISDEEAKLAVMVQEIIDKNIYKVPTKAKKPFNTGKDFNCTSPLHVKYLLYTLMGLPDNVGKKKGSTDKDVLNDINLPITNQILKVRSLSTLINTFVDKLPNSVTPDGRIHAQFNSVIAATGRMCIAKGTKITCLNGTKNIEDIQPGDIVYCYDIETQSLKLSKVNHLWLTGKDRECVKIKWQSTGKGDIGELICTPEHRILKKSGEWCRADELKRYDKLVHLRRTPGPEKEPRPCLYGWNGLYTREQDIVKSEIFKCDDTRMIIHHKDEKVSNNDLSNLELRTPKDHLSHHGKVRAQRGEISTEQLHSRETVEKSIRTRHENYIKRIRDSKQILLDKIKQCKGRISYLPEDYTCFKNQCEIAGINIEEECRKYNPRYHKERIPENEFRSVYAMYEGLAIRIIEHFHISYDKFYKYCEEYNISRNHMVQSVKPCGKYDVYDIEVEGYHNFIAGEICVHNSSSNPNLQNIPSHAVDIRHMFRATPGYVLISSDYSAQEPRVTAFISGDPKMQQAFRDGRDVYATVASFAFGVPYEQCLEFHPETHEYQPEGKQRRNEAKFILLGISYGRSVPSIADQLYGKRTDMSDEEKVSKAQEVYDKVLNSFPHLRNAMIGAENQARTKGYVETILGRRRHLPNMQLPKYEFTAMQGYVNPDIDPLDVSTLDNKDSIPPRIVKQLTKEFESLKYWGQVVKRTKELAEQKIRVINNKTKIAEESRKTLNSIIQGSAADQTKMAMIALYHNEEWKKIGGRLLIPVHDELIAEVPEEYKDEGGRILSQTMVDAASFLPFPSKCDVEMCIHWYGLAYPCEYDKPSSLDNMSDSNVKWIQYMLYECEYKLPTHKEEFGENFRGDIAKGVDGIYSDEVRSYIHDYRCKYNITDDASFINHIEKHVYQGT